MSRLKDVSLGISIGFVLGLALAIAFAVFLLLQECESSRILDMKVAVKRGDLTSFQSLLSLLSSYDPEYIDECAHRYPEQTLLQLVIRESKEPQRSEMIRILLAKGADPNAIDSRGNTPLVRAIELADRYEEVGSPGVVKQLLAAGARVNEPSGPYLETPLFRASRYADAKLVEMLITHGADVHARDRDGQTPLHAAAMSASLTSEIESTIRVLLQYGADPMIQDRKGKRPIDLLHELRYTKEIHDLLVPEQG